MRAEEYAGNFAHQKVLKEATLDQLDRNLVFLYAEVLLLLWRAQAFYDKSTFGISRRQVHLDLVLIRPGRYLTAGFKPFEKSFGVHLGLPGPPTPSQFPGIMKD